MKVLLDATVLDCEATGIAKATVGLWNACVELDDTIEPVAVHRNELAIVVPPTMESTAMVSFLPNNIWRPLVLASYAYATRPDVIHFPWNGNIPRFLPDAFRVMTLHNVLPLSIPNYFSSGKARVAYMNSIQKDLDRADLVITDSDYSKTQICKYFQTQREPLTIYLATSLNETKTAPVPNQRQFGDYFLYVGGYDPRKGLEQMLRVFVDLWRTGAISERLVIAGSQKYYSDEVETLINAGREMGKVFETGYVSDEQLTALYTAAVCLVYPSKYESFGLPALEAMSLGCPVLTTRYSSIPEICQDGAGYFEPDDKEDFSRALTTIAQSPGIRKTLSALGRERAKAFSWKRSAQTFLEELEFLMVGED